MAPVTGNCVPNEITGYQYYVDFEGFKFICDNDETSPASNILSLSDRTDLTSHSQNHIYMYIELRQNGKYTVGRIEMSRGDLNYPLWEGSGFLYFHE